MRHLTNRSKSTRKFCHGLKLPAPTTPIPPRTSGVDASFQLVVIPCTSCLFIQVDFPTNKPSLYWRSHFSDTPPTCLSLDGTFGCAQMPQIAFERVGPRAKETNGKPLSIYGAVFAFFFCTQRAPTPHPNCVPRACVVRENTCTTAAAFFVGAAALSFAAMYI